MGKIPADELLPVQRVTRTSRMRNLGVLSIAAAAAYVLLRQSAFELHHGASKSRQVSTMRASDPADEWQDNIWPMRQPTPWDISTDFPKPRKLEYEVTEGTWMRLDVHPKTGEIVFDLLGELYCLAPPSTIAHPVLLGVPHDVDPHFSPSGEQLAFRSDAELGVDNIWVVPWTSCEEMSVRPGNARDTLASALTRQDEDEALLASGVRETAERKTRRLLREGRLHAHRVTNETYRFVTDPRWHPSGDRIVATKWYFSTRSIGGGEGWEYNVPPVESHISVGAGKRLLSRDLPSGWSTEQYGEQQVGPEQAIWAGQDSLIFAKNVLDVDGTFQYSKDVHSGIYAIFQKNITTGKTTRLVSNSPGGASRPELSRDGRTLAFVRRVRDKEALVFYDLQSGTLRHIWYGLTYDNSPIYAPMGTYPSFSWVPGDDAVVIWAAGKLWRVPVKVNESGEKDIGGAPSQIPFTAKIEKRIAQTLRPETNLLPVETATEQRLYAFHDLDVNYDGTQVLFNAAGVTYVQNLPSASNAAKKVPVLHSGTDYAYYAPSYIPHTANIIHARWHDTEFTSFEIAQLTTGRVIELTGLPLGRYAAPTLCSCVGNKRRIAFVRVRGTTATGKTVAVAGAGLYVADVLLPFNFHEAETAEITNIRLVSSDITSSPLKLRFEDGANRLLVQNEDRAYYIDLTSQDAFGQFAETSVASGRMASEVAISESHFAFVERMHVYLALKEQISSEGAWAKPGNSTKDLARLSLDGGHSLSFSQNGQWLFWFLGPYLHGVEVKKLNNCARAVREDTQTFGIHCVKYLLDVHEVHVSYPTANVVAKGIFAVKNATLVTMASGTFEQDVIYNGTIVVQDGVFLAAGPGNDIQFFTHGGEADISDIATVIDAQGGIVVPGFLDAHAHWTGHFDEPFSLPARDWQHAAFLAYGITTLHNPSFDHVGGYVERALVERGRMIGPRIYHTGGVIYGAEAASLHHDIVDLDEAREALIRIKVEGGPSSFSYKNYQLPSRASRQRLLLTAKNLSMICVPEGGMNFDWDTTYIEDGMTTVEHAIPVPVLYDDFLTLFSLSGTANAPTHIVNYGGPFGQEILWATNDVPNDPKLRTFIPHGDLQTLSESFTRPRHSYALYNTSASVAEFVSRGGLAGVGAHGQPPLGLMYHLEVAFFESGGLSAYNVLKAATRMGAQSIGIFDSVGSLSPGKLADFVVYPPGNDILQDLSASSQIRYVARGGRVWEADTMEEVWPEKGKASQTPPVNAD